VQRRRERVGLQPAAARGARLRLLLGAHVRVRLELVGEGVLLVEGRLVLADDHLQLVLHRQLVPVPDHLGSL
jgi:hypothetical protein